nr:microtubule-actin cross-linking factor 1 isoform X28 [Equus caballus]
MGNSLGCVKEPKDSIAIPGKAPISPKKRVRFKRKWRGKKTPTPELSHEEEPLEGTGVIEETKTLRKLTVSLGKEEGVGGVEHLPPDILLPGEAAPSSGVGDQGMIVQVKERFQGEIQTAHLLLENESSVARGVWDSLEEGMTVIAHLLDNPAERNCEKSVSQLVEFPRTASCSSRAVLLPLQGETAVEKGDTQLGFQSSTFPRTDYPTDAGNQDQLSDSWSVRGGTKGILSAPQTGSWIAEGSVPSSLLDQSRGHRHTQPAHVGRVPPQGPRLPTSQSDLSISGMTVSILPSSSGYGSDGPHLHGIQPKDIEPEKSSTSFSEEDGTFSLEASHTPSWGLEEISDIYISGESGDMSAKEKLLLWTQKVTAGYTGIKCTNFSSCWSDGKMFNALIHRYRPDLVDMERVQIQSNRENLEQAFEVAERLGVTRLLDAEDVDVPSPDEKSVITYVSSIYDAFPKVPEGGEGISATEVDSRWQEYQSRVDSLIPWIKQHIILMSDKSFPQNPVELKALYNQYIHFKETEILAKEREKGRIEELYKLLEVWIEFGRIKLPQGYHPNDVEEEWGKLIIEMLEREKSLRPAVERLELLLQIANKIQNGALNCEEKLTLAKNTLQADAAHLESGQPVQCESDVIMYIQECEGLIRQLQVDLQILRDENYYQLEELAFRVMRLQDELVTLRLECTNLYRKGHFTSLELVPPSTLTTTHLKAEPLTKGSHSSSASWFRKPMTRAELVSISSSEDEGNLRFVYELLSWVEEMQMKLERAEWGNDLPSVELQLETQQHIHTSVEELGSSVKEARLYEGKMSQNFHTSYVETLGKLETQYCKLKETSSFRMRHLQSLHKFVSRATAELIWLNEKEEEELAYDWSDNNPNISAKRNYFSELTMELEEKQDVFRSLQDTAELLSLENHPAKQTVEAYNAAVQSQLQWMKQLCLCVEQHVKENTAYFQFFSDARDLESFLRNLQDSIKRKYSCDHNTSLSRLEDLLQDSMAQDEKEQLIQSKSSVASLVGRSKSIVQLKPRSPDHVLKSTISVKAICDYRQIEITICKNDECVLEDNSQRTKWKVISPTGNEAMVPSVCFLIPPPNKDAIEMASRVEQSYQKVMALWHQLHVNTKSLISWNYLRKDLDLVKTWNLEKLRSSAPGECHQVMKNLQAHYEDFLQDSRDSVLFSVADRLRLEEEVEACKTHFQHLMKSMENEDKEETVAKMYISELKNIRLRLEECEQRLVKRIQSPASSRTDKDARQDNALRIAEQEHTQEDLQQLKSDLDAVSMKCNSFLHQSPSGSSVPTLRSELNLLVEKMDHVYGLSTVYLNKLQTIDLIVRSIQDAELLVKGCEIKLSQEAAVPADLSALESHRSTLRHWLSDVKHKNSVFSVLDEEISKAKVVAEQLSRLTPERNLDLERYQEKGSQLQERWHRVISQLETRQSELESIQEVLGDYRACHGTLIKWIEETTAQQEMMKPGQAEDSRELSEQLSQQTDLFAEIERNQTKLDQCQKFSQQYSTLVKDYELQLMTYKAFVESQQKSPGKRRRMLSSSDAITQEFMDLRTRYTALVTLTTQHVKYISDALRRLEEEEKVVEEEKQEHVEKVKELLGWVSALARNTQSKATSSQTKESTDIEKAILEQQVLAEELTTKREQVSEAIKTSQIFLAKHGHKLSEKEKEQIAEQLNALNKAYHDLCDGSANQLQQLQSQLAQQTEQKGCRAVAGVIDLGTVEIFPIFRAMQKGLIDQDTGLVLLESQVIMSGLIAPETSEKLSLEEGLARNLINPQMYQQLRELQDALSLISKLTESEGPLSVVEAIEKKVISERVGLRILEAHLATGGFSLPPSKNYVNLEEAFHQGLISAWLYSELESHLRSSKNLIDPNTAEKIGLLDLMQRCIVHEESGLKLLPVKQLAGGMVSLKSGRKVSIFRAVQEGLIDRQVTVRLLEAQLFAGGIVDPRTGHRLTVEEAVRHNLIDQDMACAILIRQLQTGGIIDTVTGRRLTIDESVSNDLVAAKIALVILESLWSVMGLLWPESGEILPITDALEQGIVSTELAHKILSGRQHIKALFLPATREIWTWKKAIENGMLDKDLANNLKSICIPDVMPHIQLADSSERSKLNISPGAAGLLCSKGPTEGRASHSEKLLFELMTHSYIDVRNGERLLLLDSALIETLRARRERQADPPEVLGIGRQSLETPEELQESVRVKITGTSSDGLTVRPRKFHFSSQSKAYPDQANCTESESKKTIVETEVSFIENPKKDLFVGQQKVGIPNVNTLKVINKVKSELKRQLLATKKEDQTEMSSRENVSRGSLFTVPPEETEDVTLVVDKNPFSIETPKEEWQTIRKASLMCQKEEANTLETKYIPGETGRPLLKPQSEKSQFQVEKTLALESELKPENDMDIHSLDKKEALHKTSRDDHKQSPKGQNIAGGSMMMLEKTNEEDDGCETSLSSSHPSELLEEATLNILSAQLLDGGIFHEQTGQKLLLNEAVARGIVPSHTAVKLMGKLNMFRGFFDSQTCESLTTEEVIDEGLMDEKLLHNVLMADKAISGVLDPRTHTLCSVKEAVAVGLLDTQTATRILEGQVVTGGIVDLKRGKKVSVTLASNLGLVDSADQTELINLEKASKGRDAEKTVMERLISLQMETTGIMDPDSKAPLTIVESIDRGLLEREEAVRLLTKQVVDGGIIHHISGMRLSVDNAFKHGIIDEDLAKQLKKVESLSLHQFFHPETKETISLLEAINLDLVTPDLKREIQEIQALTGSFVDLISSQRLTLAEAKKEGLLTNKAILSSGMMHGIVDPENYRIVPYSELIKKCKIDIDSGQRYLEVIPFSDIKDGVSDKVLTLSQATQLGKVEFAYTLKVLEAQANTGGIIDPATGKRLTLASALEQKLVDENMVRIIASHQVLNGGIVDIFNDQRVTLKEAIEQGFISPELATMIQIDTLESSDHWAQTEKQDGIEACELKREFLRKEMLIACTQTAGMSCGKGESEKLFKIQSQSAQEKVKIRVSDGEQAKMSREISLSELECKDQDKRRASPNAEESVSFIIPSDRKGKSLGQVSVTHPHSEDSDFNLKEVASNNMEKNTNEEQEKIVAQVEIISHVKQSTSGLDSKEIKENQEEIISEVQESNCVTSGKFLSEQFMQKLMNTREKSKREKREMIVEESVRTYKPAVHSEEKLNQETAIREDHDSNIKSQPTEVTVSEKGKEADRELGFSLICKAEDSSSQMIPQGISVRNQDALTFFSSNQVSEKVKNLSLSLTLKAEENLSQDITGGTQSEPLSSMTPRPEGLHYQESVGKAQVTDISQISKTDKSFQGTTRQETNYYQDSCVTFKTEETKDLSCSSDEYKEKMYQEVPFNSRRFFKLEETTVSGVDPKEVHFVEFSDRKDLHHQDSKNDSELCGILESKIVTTQEITGEKFPEMSNPIITGAEAGSFKGIVTQGVPRVLVSLLPEKVFKDGSQKENTGQQDATIIPALPQTSEEKTVPLIHPTVKMDEKTPQEELRETPGSEQTPFVTAPREKGSEGVNLEPCRATKNVFNRRLCLEHDEKLVSYLSLLRDIEMRTKQIQPLELDLAELRDLLCQAKILDKELKDLSTLVSQELECVNQIIVSQPQEVPAQLLKALEKDAKNLQKSLSSVTDTWSSRLLHLQSAVEVKKTKVLTQHEQLEGKLQDLRAWVGNTNLILNSKEYNSEIDAESLSHCLQQYEDLKQPMAERKSQLDALGFDIQFFISEHAQDLSPQQNRQMLRLLNELQRAFQGLVEQTAAQMDALQGRLQQVEQAARVKTLQKQQNTCHQKLEDLCSWLGQAERALVGHQSRATQQDLSALQKNQSDLKDLQDDIQNHATSFASIVKDVEGFLEENQTKLSPHELTALREKLHQAKQQYEALQEQMRVAQKELEEVVTSALQQETEKSKAAKELAENRSKIDALLEWVTSVGSSGGQMERPSGASLEKRALDTTDGHIGMNQAPEKLDKQCEKMKARHQELLSQQQNFILATQSAQAFLDQQGHNLKPEDQQVLQEKLGELKEQYAASLAQAEAKLKRVQTLRDELQKFLQDHGEFENWLERSEKELENMHKGVSSPEALPSLLKRQGSFSEDVISHKGDLRFVTISGQKVLDTENSFEEGRELSATGTLVKDKLKDATERYTALHSKCTRLGSHLNMLLGQYQQFQSGANSLQTWMQACEANVEKLLSDTVASDPGVLQQQLATTKQLQEELAEHQVPIEKLQKVARDLMEIEGEPAPDHKHVQETIDSILSHFQSLSGSLAERSALLQKAIAQSQSVQESLDNLLQSIREVERNLEEEQVPSLSSGVIQEALTTSMKLKQDIAWQKSSLEATREMVTRFMETADSTTAAVLQSKLAEVSQRFEQLCLQQQEKESSLKKLLPQAEMFEHLSDKLQQFMENKSRMLASGNQPDQDIAHFFQQIQELNLEMEDQRENLDTLEHLVTDLSSCGFALDLSQHQDRVHNLKRDFTELQKTVKERGEDASSCQEQLDEFRKLVRTFQKWLKETEGTIPPTETFMSTKELEKQIEHLKGLLDDWASKGTLVEEINCKGTSLENLIMEITAPDSQAKTGSILPSVGSSVGSVNGYHTCKDLTEIQCDMSDVNLKYEKLGGILQERHESLQAVLSRMQEVQKEASSVLQWLESKEEVLKAMDASSPTKTETVRAQAESNKAFLTELEQNSPKIQKVKEALAGLLITYPNSQEAENWKKMQEELNSRWERATEVTMARQRQLEESASHLACFQAAESQLRPWLMEKELMMGVLGPLSIDPNMLNAQKQQVQFMLKEFEARRQQHEQLKEAAQGILTGPGDISPSTSQVQKELQSINQKWIELTDKLNSRSSQIDQAIVKSTQYQELLQDLSEKVKAVGQRLSGQSAISTQPEAVKQQLEETSEIRSDVEQLDHEINEAQTLCDELSVLIGEQYLKDELKKRLETVALPLQGLEDLAADRMNRLQAALASTQQFQQMFDELRTWLDDKQSQQAKNCPISAKLERLQSQLQENEEFQKSLNQHSGSYEVIVTEGESLLLSVPPGEEKKTLQNQLVELKNHWEELSKKTADRQSRLKDCMQKAQKYQWHVEDLMPWIEDCKAKMSDLRVTLDPVQLESSLLRSKAMLSEVEKRRSLLEILNSAADILINSSETDEDDIRDEKAGINQNMDSITEELQAKTGSLEEMTQRLKEFQESFKNIEKKVEGAKHQLEIFDALGSQACSNKNLEKLRAQQEVLQTLEPQVDYLRNFTRGLVEDAPDGSDASQLLHQAEVTQQEFLEVKQRVNSSCMTMENKLEGIGQFHCRVREMFSQLADLDDELDGMSAIGRDTDSLQSQIEDVRQFLNKIQVLKLDIEASEAECRQMLEEDGTLDLLGLKRELEALNKQCGKLTERSKARQEQLELTLDRVEDFYRKLKVLNDMTTAAEEGEALQWVVGTEVDIINQQLADFKMFQKLVLQILPCKRRRGPVLH